MNIVIRVDAAKHIGTGHMHRCITLAKKLVAHGADVKFVMVAFDGGLIQFVENNGFEVIPMTIGNLPVDVNDESSWASHSEEEDAQKFLTSVSELQVDCCIVDHYALSQVWECLIADKVNCIVVIDDLANRNHYCQLLLDQNYWPNYLHRYDGLVPNNCVLLLGPAYSLLRDEFLELRQASYALNRQTNNTLKVLVNFGGIGNMNLLRNFCLAIRNFKQYTFTIITGALPSENIKELQNLLVQQDSTHVTLSRNTTQMGELMAESDFAFGACGSTVWERFCLGLNSALVEVANNQRQLLHYLNEQDLIDCLGSIHTLTQVKIETYLSQLDITNSHYANRKQVIMGLVDGRGAAKVSAQIQELINVKR